MQALFLIGRILLGGYFIYSAYNHFKDIGGMSGYAKMKGVPAAKAGVILSGVMFGIGGLAIVFNRYAILGMIVTALALIPITIMMHPFWKEKEPSARMMERIQFTKNIAIIGSLILLISIG